MTTRVCEWMCVCVFVGLCCSFARHGSKKLKEKNIYQRMGTYTGGQMFSPVRFFRDEMIHCVFS